MLSRPQLFQDIQASVAWVSEPLRCLYDRARMLVAHHWFLTHTGVRQGDNLGPGLFRRSCDAGVAEWHADLVQHPWAQRLSCTCESGTLVLSAVHGLARSSIARSHMELSDINHLSTSSVAAALGRRAFRALIGNTSLLSQLSADWVPRLQLFFDCFQWTLKQLVFAPFFLNCADG